MTLPQTNSIDEIRALLQAFQEGYTRRDPARLDEFMQLFSRERPLEVIGTGGVDPGDEEWLLDLDGARTLIESDWRYWGDLVLDLAQARITTLGDAGWIACRGTVSMKLSAESTYQDFMGYMRSVIDRENGSPESKLLEILRGGTNTLFEVQRGEDYIWPLRFCAVVAREAPGWRFVQMQFSFATTRYPDPRLVNGILRS